MTDELRDSWTCPDCGCGFCTPRGQKPKESIHAPCGLAYELSGPCSCSPDHPDYKADE